MSLRKFLRVVTGGGTASGKTLPPADYSGEPTDADIKAIRERFDPELKAEDVKVVSGPAW